MALVIGLIGLADADSVTRIATQKAFACQLRVPLRRFDGVELGTNADLLQMRAQKRRRIASRGNVVHRQLGREPVLRSVNELPYDCAGLGTVRRDMGIVAKLTPQHVWRHASHPSGANSMMPPMSCLSPGEHLNEDLPVEAQCHRLPRFALVESRCVRVDQHRSADVCRRDLGDRLRHLSLEIFQPRHRHAVGRGDIEFGGEGRQIARRDLPHDRVFDAVEVWLSRFPVIRILGEFDVSVRLELAEFEGAGANRVLPHLARRHKTG